LPADARKFLRYLLAFGVTFVVGVAPLVGKFDVPGLTRILDLYPVSLQANLVPFSAFAMAVVAVCVQFYAADKLRPDRLRRWFTIMLGVVAICAGVVFTSMTLFVVSVPWHGNDRVARYVVGVHRKATCRCPPSKEIPECVGHEMTFAYVPIESCYPDREIGLRKLALSLPYLLLMTTFGGMIGLVILKESGGGTLRRDRKRQRQSRVRVNER
jgi:hypothetical protein